MKQCKSYKRVKSKRPISHRFHVYLVVFFFAFFTFFYCILSVFMDCWSDTNKMMMMNDDDDDDKTHEIKMFSGYF